MNWEYKVSVYVVATYDLVEPKGLDVAVKEYTSRKGNCCMSDDLRKLHYSTTITLRFDSFADMCANFEKELLNELGDYVKFVENWNIKFNITQISGYDVYF